MMLSTTYPIDAIELQWAQQIRSSEYPVARIASISGRSEAEWAAALAAGWAPFPTNYTIRERYQVVGAAVIAGASVACTSKLARAPRAWVAEAMRRVFEPVGLPDRELPELYRRTQARLAPPLPSAKGAEE